MPWTEAQKEYARHVMTHVEVSGLTELVRAFRKLDKKVKREIQKELREVAKPAAERARNKGTQLRPSLNQYTITGIRPGSRMGMAVVRQIRRATTHKRADFSFMQLTHVLEPAALETMPEARERLEKALDNIAYLFNAGGEIS